MCLRFQNAYPDRFLNLANTFHPQTLPPGIAPNEALRENIFVLVVCICNRLPVFLVGKPGCSKSLSVQLIFDHLRGEDSSDEFFRSLPRVAEGFSFQGSQETTSAGILRVFRRARDYDARNADVTPLVLLDEIGLAEISPHNPLKARCAHSLCSFCSLCSCGPVLVAFAQRVHLTERAHAPMRR